MSHKGLHSLRESIIASWRDAFWGTFADESARFFKSNPDRFSNPIGTIFTRDSERLVDGLLNGASSEELSQDLEGTVRVQAVQEKSPGQSLAFLLMLKKVAREKVAGAENAAQLGEELAHFEDAVDRMLLTAFDVYNKCREDIFSIRVKEIQNRSMKVMERLNEWRDRRAERAEPEVDRADS